MQLEANNIYHVFIRGNNYPQVCFNYIHLNPVTDKIVENKDDWEFSSYRNHARLRNGKLINRERTMEFGLKI